MEFQGAVVLQVQTLGVVGSEEEERCVFGFCVARERQRQLLGRVNVELGLICARAHDPVSIFAYSNTIAGYGILLARVSETSGWVVEVHTFLKLKLL